jgi:hypothetical protein
MGEAVRSEGELGKLGKKLNSLCRRLRKSGQVFLIFTVRLKTGPKNAGALSCHFGSFKKNENHFDDAGLP